MSRVTATECAGAVGTWREHEVAKRVAAASIARRREGTRTFSCSDAGPADMKPPGREPNIKSILLLSQAGGGFDTCRNGAVCGAQGVAWRPGPASPFGLTGPAACRSRLRPGRPGARTPPNRADDPGPPNARPGLPRVPRRAPCRT